jgi:hypothetical protein
LASHSLGVGFDPSALSFDIRKIGGSLCIDFENPESAAEVNPPPAIT